MERNWSNTVCRGERQYIIFLSEASGRESETHPKKCFPFLALAWPVQLLMSVLVSILVVASSCFSFSIEIHGSSCALLFPGVSKSSQWK